MFDKTADERIRDQTIAMILCVNDTCPDEKFRLAMRSVVMSEIDRMWRRLKELSCEDWGNANYANSDRPRRDSSQLTESQRQVARA